VQSSIIWLAKGCTLPVCSIQIVVLYYHEQFMIKCFLAAFAKQLYYGCLLEVFSLA